MTIKAVCFDLDDTLLWDERSVAETFEAVCQDVASISGVDPVILGKAIRTEARKLYEAQVTFPFTKRIGINAYEGLWATFDRGQQPEFRTLEQWVPAYRSEAWYRALQVCGVDDRELGAELGDRFVAERRRRVYLYEESMGTLDRLKGTVKLLLITNGCPALQREKLNGVPELISYFDDIIISGDFGIGKPDVSIFRHALEVLEVEADEAVMIGDKLTTDIQGANAAGITSIWLNRHRKSRSEEIVPTYEVEHLSEIFPLIASL